MPGIRIHIVAWIVGMSLGRRFFSTSNEGVERRHGMVSMAHAYHREQGSETPRTAWRHWILTAGDHSSPCHGAGASVLFTTEGQIND